MKTDIYRNKFLLLVPYTYPDFSGSGRNAFNFGKFLVKKGISVRIVTLNRNQEYKRHETMDGLSIYRIAYLNKNLLLKIISLSWVLPVYFVRICHSDIIYIFGKNLIAWQLVALSARLCGKKVIFRSLIFGEDDVIELISGRNHFIRILNKFLINRFDCYFSIHPSFSERYINLVDNNNRLLELPQGVDHEIFYPVSTEEKINIRKKLELPVSEFIIISVAFLINRKGFEEIFDRLHLLRIPFQYCIVGENNFEGDHFLSNLQSEALRLKKRGMDLLGPHLILTGPKENINEYIQAADLCLFNSKAEGLPNAMLETMASGVTVVSNEIAGLKDYLLRDKENSLIFSNITDLNKLVELLYYDPELKRSLGIKARETIMNSGTFEVVLKSIFNKFQIG